MTAPKVIVAAASTPSPPSISIVIPCFNAGAFLAETVRSVVGQTRADWEIVIVDDGSTDDTLSVALSIAEWPHPITVVSQVNAGAPAARNTGVTQTSPTSRYLLFLDADDVLEATMLETVTGHMDRHPEVGMVHCGWKYIDDAGTPVALDPPRLLPRSAPAGLWARELRDDELETPFAAIFCAAGMTPSMSVLRRSTFESVGAWDEDFGEPAGDTYLFMRVALASKVHFLSQPLVGYRLHATQMTTDRDRLSAQWRRLEAKWADHASLPEDQRRTVIEAWQFRERGFALRNGLRHAREETRARNYVQAVRFAGGAVRIALRSLVLGPPPRRRR